MTDALDTLAAEIVAARQALDLSMRATVEHAIAIGRLLISARRRVPHGGWLPFIEQRCRISARSAQNYMRLARWFAKLDDENAKRISQLTVRQALDDASRLSRMTARHRADAIAKAESGRWSIDTATRHANARAAADRRKRRGIAFSLETKMALRWRERGERLAESLWSLCERLGADFTLEVIELLRERLDKAEREARAAAEREARASSMRAAAE